MGRESSDRSHFNSRLLSKQIQVCCIMVGQNGWAWPPTYPPKWLNQPLYGETKQRLSLSGSATCVSWQTKFYKQLSFCLWMDGWIDWLMAPKAVWVKDALRLDSLSLSLPNRLSTRWRLRFARFGRGPTLRVDLSLSILALPEALFISNRLSESVANNTTNSIRVDLFRMQIAICKWEWVSELVRETLAMRNSL